MPRKRKLETAAASDNDQSSEKKNISSGQSRRKVKAKSKADSVSSDIHYSHWLMKSEPESRFEKGVDVKFGIEDLKSCPKQTACWDGVRNYQMNTWLFLDCIAKTIVRDYARHQARNFMRDQMRVGHKVFFYHSNTKEPGIAGICEVVRESYEDHTQFDSKDPHYDSSSKKDNPKWFMVDVQFKRMMKRYIPLSELKSLHLKHKESGGPLKDMALFTRARLSVQPIKQEEWDFILSLEDKE